MKASSEDYHGIIILGFPRSGTTLLRRLINAHPAIHCPPETNLLNAAGRFLQEEPFGDGLATGVVPGLEFCAIAQDEILDRLRSFTISLLNTIRDRAGKKRWAEKTAFASFHVDQIERLLGNHCRFLCVFRHPLDVACSVKELCDEMGIYLQELHQYIRQYPEPMVAFSHAWLDVNMRLLQFSEDHPDRCISLRYEQLVDQPAEQLRRILQFLDEPFDPHELIQCAMGNMSGVGLGDWKTYEASSINNVSVDRWMRQLPEHMVGRLGKIVNPLMPRLGYEPVPEVEQKSSAEAQRRYQLERMVARMRSQASAIEDKK